MGLQKVTTRQATFVYKVKLWRVRATILCRGKAMSITYSECVSVASVIQHAMRMRRIILPSVACLPLPIFFRIIL